MLHGLSTLCHDARKGGYTGSRWPKHHGFPLYSTACPVAPADGTGVGLWLKKAVGQNNPIDTRCILS